MTIGKDPSINKMALAREINDALPHLSLSEAGTVVDGIIACFTEKFVIGEEIKISGFGKFTVAEKAPRRGRNPQTGEELTIPAHRVVKFKVSHVLREELNEVPVMVEHAADHA